MLVNTSLCWSLAVSVVSINVTYSLAVNASIQQSLLVSNSLCWTLAVFAGRLQSLVVSIILIWSLAVYVSL